MVRITIDKENCIGCGACVATAPEVFEMNDEGKAEVLKIELTDEEIEKTKEAVSVCPVNVIDVE